MATNLISTITQSFSSDAIGKLASALGLEQGAAQKGISAAIPGVLAGLSNVASGYEGAQKIGRAITQVESLAGSGGDTLKNLLETGKSSLGSGWNIGSSILGSGAIETLATAVAKYAGFDLGSAKKLLSFLIPAVLGLLKHEQTKFGLDNQALANLLVSQKADIERALPAGLLTPVASEQPRPAVRQTAPSANAGYKSASSSSSQGWANWILPALLIAAAAFYFLPQQKTAQEIAASLQNDIGAGIERLRVALPKVSDPLTAQSAVSEIKDVSKRLAELKTAALQLPAEAQKTVSDALSAKISELDAIIDRITKQINYLSGEAKPAIDTLKTELGNLSKE